MEQLWPAPTDDVAEAIRRIAERLLPEVEGLSDSVSSRALSAQGAPILVADASLSEQDRQLNRFEVVQWVTSNIQQPGSRVAPHISPQSVDYLRDLFARGIEPNFAAGWQAAMSVAWRRWLELSVKQCAEASLLVEVLDVTAQSMAQYAVDAIDAHRELSRSSAVVGSGIAHMDVIQSIVDGAVTAEDVAEQRLRYRLRRSHTCVILSVSDVAYAQALEVAVGRLRATVEARCILSAKASSTSWWVWLSGESVPSAAEIAAELAGVDHVRVALGKRGSGLAGFRSSLNGALAAQALITRLRSDRAFTNYADVELVDALTQDIEAARKFVLSSLGPLAAADADLRTTLLTYIQCGFNSTRTASQLFAHRNTVERRLARARELSAVPADANPTQVGAALAILDLAPNLLTS